MKIKRLLSFAVIPLLLASCVSDKQPEGYDYIVGDDYKDLVKLTFKYGNIEGKIGQTYKVWGVKRGSTTDGLEPKKPDERYSIMPLYGFTLDFKAGDEEAMGPYEFRTTSWKEDTTIFIKYYEPMQEIRFCIPDGGSGKGSGMMFSQKNIYGNTEIYKLPTLDNQTIDSDWGEFKLLESLDPWVSNRGYSKIDGWYYDEALTKPITLPFRLSHNGDELKWWAKCS